MPSSDLHPELRRVARLLPKRAITPRSVPVFRAATRLFDRRPPEGVEVTVLPSGLTIRAVRAPRGIEAPALLWLHGGGYLVGSASQDDQWSLRMSRDLGITVASVDYRLAPEHPYPAPLEDAYEGLLWLARQPGVDATRVAIGGGSAGGGLAAALALLARDRAEVDVAGQLLAYPMLDDRTCDREGMDDDAHRLWDQRSNRFGWDAYLGDADRSVAVPGRRDDLAGLPPTWIGVGTLDLFHDEDVAYAGRLRDAGIAVDLEVTPGGFHAFDLLAPRTGVSRQFYDSQRTWLANLFGADRP
jgi:acetyl esterase/lipase